MKGGEGERKYKEKRPKSKPEVPKTQKGDDKGVKEQIMFQIFNKNFLTLRIPLKERGDRGEKRG